MTLFLFSMLQICSFLTNPSFAKPAEGPTPESVCQSINSNKYVAQCKSAIYKGYFDPKALPYCLEQTSDYDKKSCMEVIRGKDYTKGQLEACKTNPKVRINKCLQLNGELRKETPVEADKPAEIEG